MKNIMKLLFYSLFFYSNISYSQLDKITIIDSPIVVQNNSKDRLLLNKIIPAEIICLNSIYIYNNKKDTIILSNIEANDYCTCNKFKIIDSIQIDGVGSKEIIFLRSCRFAINKHGGLFDITEKVKFSKYEIWNLDTKQLLFEAVNSYKSDYKRIEYNKNPRRTKGIESWSYNFNIDRTGQIKISQLRSKTKAYKYQMRKVLKKAKCKTIYVKSPYTYAFTSDNQEGTYIFKNGKYTLE